MTIHSSIDSLNLALFTFRQKKASVGLVPTMGALHRGHLELVSQALAENEVVVVSIFVNPTQFNNPDDLTKYPRTLEEDTALLANLNKNIVVFNPDATHLYEGAIQSKRYNFSGLEHEMEGKHRPGHFDGVGTVLNLLFRAVQPNKAYFGEKDFQQLQIVRKLTLIEKLPVTIVGCAIVRESHGLAMSSRNQRLTKIQFEEAAIIYTILQEVRMKFDTLSVPGLIRLAEQRFSENSNFALEYFEISSETTLKPAQRKHKNNSYRAFVAAFAGEVRLIDNIALN